MTRIGEDASKYVQQLGFDYEEFTQEALQKLDVNKDGEVSLEEIKPALDEATAGLTSSAVGADAVLQSYGLIREIREGQEDMVKVKTSHHAVQKLLDKGDVGKALERLAKSDPELRALFPNDAAVQDLKWNAENRSPEVDDRTAKALVTAWLSGDKTAARALAKSSARLQANETALRTLITRSTDASGKPEEGRIKEIISRVFALRDKEAERLGKEHGGGKVYGLSAGADLEMSELLQEGLKSLGRINTQEADEYERKAKFYGTLQTGAEFVRDTAANAVNAAADLPGPQQGALKGIAAGMNGVLAGIDSLAKGESLEAAGLRAALYGLQTLIPAGKMKGGDLLKAVGQATTRAAADVAASVQSGSLPKEKAAEAMLNAFVAHFGKELAQMLGQKMGGKLTEKLSKAAGGNMSASGFADMAKEVMQDVEKFLGPKATAALQTVAGTVYDRFVQPNLPTYAG
ncbi:MAG: hypothetical protein HYV63_33710 [Candidatus Schekmanbacteria bacterium]|nr:hypothetical protein [Candidatus Schekmanbacteria bacterium]